MQGDFSKARWRRRLARQGFVTMLAYAFPGLLLRLSPGYGTGIEIRHQGLFALGALINHGTLVRRSLVPAIGVVLDIGDALGIDVPGPLPFAVCGFHN